MKVALINRSTMLRSQGGDTIQMMNTARELKKLGVTAHIYYARERINYEQYDLLHLFNLIRPADHLYHIRKSKKPYVLSTIYVDYEAFDRFGRGGLSSRLFALLGKSKSEYLKTIYRFLRGQDKLVSAEYLLGHRRAKEVLIREAAVLLPNSLSEYKRVIRLINHQKKLVQVVPNGIDENLFGQIPQDINRRDSVICAAQIYGRKNQLALINICNELDVELEIVGKAPPNHSEYLEDCKKAAGKKTKILSFMPQQELLKAYARAKVHALPSWFETTGLSSLEAGAMGCNLVVGEGGDTDEYFRGHAEFCEAANYQSIKDAVLRALEKPTTTDLREKILSNYTWRNAAEATLKGYELALSGLVPRAGLEPARDLSPEGF